MIKIIIVSIIVLFLVYLGTYIVIRAILTNFNHWMCDHEWETHAKIHYEDPDTDNDWFQEVLICKNCGKIKKIKY